MGSNRHKAKRSAWGKGGAIPEDVSTQRAILRLPNWTGPVRLAPDGAWKPFGDSPSSRTAKELVAAQLAYCPYPGCGPYAAVVANSEERHDTFRHRMDKSHGSDEASLETMDHSISKQIILAWILQQYDDNVLWFDLDETNVSSSGLQMRPDARVRLRSGAEIALEFQHSAIPPERIAAKSVLYSQQGITVWWVFSGRSPLTCSDVKPANFRSAWGSSIVSLNSAQLRLSELGIPFFWFDCVRGMFATPMKTVSYIKPLPGEEWPEKARLRRAYPRFPAAEHGGITRLFEHEVRECSVDLNTGHLVTPGTKAWAWGESEQQREENAQRKQARQRHADKVAWEREVAERAARAHTKEAARAAAPDVAEEPAEPINQSPGDEEGHRPLLENVPHDLCTLEMHAATKGVDDDRQAQSSRSRPWWQRVRSWFAS